MTDISAYLELGIDFSAVVLSAVGLIAMAVFRDYEKWQRKFFSVWFSVVIVYEVFSIISLIAKLEINSVLYDTTYFFECLLWSSLSPMLTFYLLHRSGESPKKAPVFYIVLTFWIIFCICLIINQTNHFIYSVDFSQINKKSKLDIPDFGLYTVFYILSEIPVIINIFAFFKRRKHFKNGGFAMLIYLISPALSLMAYFEIFIVLYIIRSYLKQREKITEQKASISALQMSPHFVINVLSSIYYLAEEEKSEKTKNAVINFLTYLQKNFAAISSEGTIPFVEELQHTKAYLEVEKALYENRLSVDIESEYTNFRLPPLTLQPIVENSIKHGMPTDNRGLTVSVSTEETEKGIIITVKDNGIGFSENDSDEPHIALANIKERLDRMCKGTLKIDSTKGKGTTVTIFVPIKK